MLRNARVIIDEDIVHGSREQRRLTGCFGAIQRTYLISTLSLKAVFCFIFRLSCSSHHNSFALPGSSSLFSQLLRTSPLSSHYALNPTEIHHHHHHQYHEQQHPHLRPLTNWNLNIPIAKRLTSDPNVHTPNTFTKSPSSTPIR